LGHFWPFLAHFGPIFGQDLILALPGLGQVLVPRPSSDGDWMIWPARSDPEGHFCSKIGPFWVIFGPFWANFGSGPGPDPTRSETRSCPQDALQTGIRGSGQPDCLRSDPRGQFWRQIGQIGHILNQDLILVFPSLGQVLVPKAFFRRGSENLTRQIVSDLAQRPILELKWDILIKID